MQTLSLRSPLLTSWSVLFVLLLIANGSQAQLSSFGRQGKLISIGLRLGANFSQLKTQNIKINPLAGNLVFDYLQQNSDYSTGLVAGGFIRIGKKFYVQPEVIFSAKGGKLDIIQINAATGVPISTDPKQLDIKFSNVDVPLMIGYKFLGFFRINVGPIASFNLSDNGTLKEQLKAYTNAPLNDTIKKAIFGYQAGIGLTFGGLNVDVRYEGNLNEITQLNFNSAQTQSQFSQKTSLWQVTMAVPLF